MPEWQNDGELFSLVRSTLYTPVAGDILDQCGRFHQFLPPPVRPLREDMKVVDFRCRIEVSGVVVRPGDLAFGDVDGVLVIPQELVEEVFSRALEKARGEKVVRQAIEAGLSSTDAFRKYGIL